MFHQVACVLLFTAVSHGFLFGRNQSNWNGLKATWGLNPFSSFQSLPRTKTEAIAHGWTAHAPGDTCDSNANFRGERYWKDNDLGVILIFDPAGYIAGIQAGFPKDYPTNPNNYPFPPLINTPLILENGNYYVTAYFVNPAHLCKGRTEVQFRNEGTGEGVWIQNGTNPVTNSVAIPKTQADAEASKWTKGVCFISMGLHFWYDMSKSMSCDNLYPVFLLYNDGVLNAFGWAFGMNLEHSSRFEHPPQSSYSNFMNPVPDCLSTLGTMTTLHIYLTDSATADTC